MYDSSSGVVMDILSEDQLRHLIAREAAMLGLSFEDAFARAAAGTLPNNYIGADLELLFDLLSL